NTDIVFTNNYITNTTDDAFFMQASDGFTMAIAATNNSITGNVNGVSFDGTGTSMEDLSCNWWGSAAAADVAAAAASSVNFSPWLVSGTDDEPGTPGFQPAGACSGTEVVINSALSAPETCSGSGSITVEFTGGTAPYDIVWTGPSPGSD